MKTLLASYPRSGNTLMRIVLNQNFGLKSGSIYPNDLGNNENLENLVGHVAHEKAHLNFQKQFPIIKTHELYDGNDRALYILRDPRPVMLSFFHFYNHKKQKLTLKNIILGNHRWGKWSDHLRSWEPSFSKNTLLIKYEDLTLDTKNSIKRISTFLGVYFTSTKLPSQQETADGRWINKAERNWLETMPKKEMELCTEINKDYLEKYDYL